MESSNDRFLPASILIAGLVIGGALVFSTLYKGGGAGSAGSGNGGGAGGSGAAAGGAGGTQPAQNLDVMKLGARDAIRGSATAPVTIVEYGDYQCPFCGNFFSQTEPQIVKNYLNAGKVKMVFRDFAFLGPESTLAANAAQCANDQGKLWAYHDALYAAKVADFNKGGREDDGIFDRALFLKLAEQVGLNAPAFTNCVDGNKDAAIVAQAKTDAANAGVNSTPYFFINGTPLIGAQPYSQFKAAIDIALGGK